MQEQSSNYMFVEEFWDTYQEHGFQAASDLAKEWTGGEPFSLQFEAIVPELVHAAKARNIKLLDFLQEMDDFNNGVKSED